MHEEGPLNEVRAGVIRWQQKYGIADGDPALACLELFDLYVASLRERKTDTTPLRFEEFRSTMEFLDQRSKGFTKHASELTQELRLVTSTHRQLRVFNITSLSITAAVTFTAGLILGIYLW
ncbi:hypothetical protein FEM03_07385 [Phragmitibacter flavus]|uniref:Uncharacterized protein n=1 Tax=Phragmitibacter flavus TaxID=2576071 RepID=A0A5R8KH88_9BACT|nr:hypothetical protein [Phragmitibacter flavus]TLD71345.1 hypothetical protein FEM03_07385 [Phragmitibacter flavus]